MGGGIWRAVDHESQLTRETRLGVNNRTILNGVNQLVMFNSIYLKSNINFIF